MNIRATARITPSERCLNDLVQIEMFLSVVYPSTMMNKAIYLAISRLPMRFILL